jgi:hypothetical protein
MVRSPSTIKKDRVLLSLIVLLGISIIGAILEGTGSMSGIGLIYLSGTILGVILTRRWRKARNYLVLLIASIGGFFISILLYNIVHGLFQHWWGVDFWGKTITGDEFLFFSIAVFICPVAFIIGAVGSITLAIKNAIHRDKPVDSATADKLSDSP